ncbi:ADP-ribose pyrophosphatase of COG1058 family (EC / Nicotinamide-nucleotide amidase (EC [Olavius algarvensis associated proteobacterium Delta 3]|nr:ADP-ribose pyrophosphatase of COG1058 family (EC / Nicotinamide-nucleotide amidase (EC [Olavius algarvensis associated proteobacterium Delta 3]CAB5101747.1 ADP-ribose pyrophosphatase of COG1058 family (EC / Nicotinamide-nucleotide amidase (EC [Olavius algarvensis associated proteobacterium Delta 3]
MIAEIIATGDEIRTGALVDSNSAYIADRLEALGIDVLRHDTIGDNIDLLSALFQEVGGRADIAVVTGGLGPTIDDLTTEAAARAADVQLALDEVALQDILRFFEKRHRTMTDSNRKQAMLPVASQRIDNPVGTAPGFSMRIGGCVFFCLPGVPPEMKRMLSESVLPKCRKLLGRTREASCIQTISTFGLPESTTGERLEGFGDRFPDIKLGLRAKFPEIQIRLYGRHVDEETLSNHMREAADWVREKIGHRVFSSEGEPMAAVIGRLLGDRQATLAVAESCTGGLISHWLTNVAGSSGYFLLGAVTYANTSKMSVLGVSTETLDRYGAVHEHTVREMADGVRRRSGATYGIATSGIAGPDGGTPDKPVGTVCIGISTPEGSEGSRFFFPFGKRQMNKQMFAMSALDLLRRKLMAADT